MGVYIRDLKKPERCIECVLFKSCTDETLFCRGKGIIFGENDKEWLLRTIPNWCPLVEIDIPIEEKVTEDGDF